jgi:hypothetical protein
MTLRPMAIGLLHDPDVVGLQAQQLDGGTVQRELYRIDPNCETWPNTLNENRY